MDIIEKTIKLSRLQMNQNEIDKIKKDVENILEVFSTSFFILSISFWFICNLDNLIVFSIMSIIIPL